jgi:predicted cupin superfamily sugar epimerase
LLPAKDNLRMVDEGATMPSAAEIIRLLDLKPHPEGGHFRETFRDPRKVDGARAASTAIYFLLARGQRSHWHKVDAAEAWHYHAGAPLKLEIAADAKGPLECVTLGADLAAGERPQAIVPAHAWAGGAKPGRMDAGELHGRARIRFQGFRARAEGLDAAGRLVTAIIPIGPSVVDLKFLQSMP